MEPVRFDLPGYIRCLGPFVQAVNRAVVQSSPLIGQIAERPTRHRGPSRNAPQPDPVEHRQESVVVNYEVPFDMIRKGDVEGFVTLLITNADEQFIRQLESQFINVVQEVTGATGGVISANGESVGFDHIIDLIDLVDLRTDENGGLRLPTIVMNPETRKTVERLEPTAEQRERLDAVLHRKLDENLRKKKTRRLGR